MQICLAQPIRFSAAVSRAVSREREMEARARGARAIILFNSVSIARGATIGMRSDSALELSPFAALFDGLSWRIQIATIHEVDQTVARINVAPENQLVITRYDFMLACSHERSIRNAGPRESAELRGGCW